MTMRPLSAAETASKPQQLVILGATGSIGESTLQIVRQHPDRYRIHTLVANTRDTIMLKLIREFQPQQVIMHDQVAADRLYQQCRDAGLSMPVLSGTEAMLQAVSEAEVDCVVAAIVGAAGLLPTFAAIQAGKKVLLANKESLVMSGQLFMQAVNDHNALLLPIDSEHNAIFQALPHDYVSQGCRLHPSRLDQAGIDRLILTASGGPFRTHTQVQLQQVTPAQAVAHPNWSMGQKISVDSATLMNKGLEFIEACWLFSVSSDDIQVVVHPQSIIHSMVRYKDGSVLAQLGTPDMCTPIAYSLAWPQRIDVQVEPLDFFQVADLSFEKPDTSRFRCLQLAIDAFDSGGTATAALNAANEVAVHYFLRKELGFLQIAETIDYVLNRIEHQTQYDLDDILAVDQKARQLAEMRIQQTS